jgi:aminoglycoside phosphotransferase (APT) family kinase protein
VVVKFCHRYCQELHVLLAENGFAPKLYGCEELKAGWIMVVMERIKGKNWQKPSATQKGKLQTVLTLMGQRGFVHGDLRAPNVLLRGTDEIFVIDFEFAGKAGEVCLPLDIDTNKFCGCKPLDVITHKLDQEMAKMLLG